MASRTIKRAALGICFITQLSLVLAFAQAPTPANITAPRPAANITAPKGATNGTATNSTAAAAKSSSQAALVAAAKARKNAENDWNWWIVRAFLYLWLGLFGLFGVSLISLVFRRYLRTMSALNPENSQNYFTSVNRYWGILKKHFVFAPLFNKRHHRPFMLTRTIDNGCLPSRPQTFLLVIYFCLMIIATFYGIKYNQKKDDMITALERRTGTLCLANMVPLIILSMRNNPLIFMTGISFDTYNLFHRWLGRFVFLFLIPHMTAFFYKRIPAQGWKSYKKSLEVNLLVRSGSIAFLCVFLILITSPAPLRHKFYETFLHLHQALVIVMLYGLYYHLEGYAKQQPLVKLLIALWAIERGFRLIRILYRSIGRPMSRAEIEIMSPIAMRVKVRFPRGWYFYPGQHAYVYMPMVGMWTAHPFSVAWSDDNADDVVSEKHAWPKTIDDFDRPKKNIYFLVRRMKGFTNKLYQKAEKNGGKLTTMALIEGPYNHQSLRSYGTVILIAAGIGITHIVPHVHDLVRGYSNGTVATKRVTMIWSVRTLEELELIREWMAIILALPRRHEVLRIILYVFQLDDGQFHSPSKSIQVFPGIAKFGPIIDEEVENSIGAIGVSVCGIGVVADEVRFACRKWMDKVNIEFMEESFSW